MLAPPGPIWANFGPISAELGPISNELRFSSGRFREICPKKAADLRGDNTKYSTTEFERSSRTSAVCHQNGEHHRLAAMDSRAPKAGSPPGASSGGKGFPARRRRGGRASLHCRFGETCGRDILHSGRICSHVVQLPAAGTASLAPWGTPPGNELSSCSVHMLQQCGCLLDLRSQSCWIRSSGNLGNWETVSAAACDFSHANAARGGKGAGDRASPAKASPPPPEVDIGRLRATYGRIRADVGRFRANVGQFRTSVGRFRAYVGRIWPSSGQIRLIPSRTRLDSDQHWPIPGQNWPMWVEGVLNLGACGPSSTEFDRCINSETRHSFINSGINSCMHSYIRTFIHSYECSLNLSTDGPSSTELDRFRHSIIHEFLN